jgi:hypothetical protein
VRILEQDGDRLAVLRESFRRSLVDAGCLVTADVVRVWVGDTAGTVDVEAVSVVLLGALVYYRRSAWTFGTSPLGIDDERFLSTWADLCVAAAQGRRASNISPRRRQPRRSSGQPDACRPARSGRVCTLRARTLHLSGGANAPGLSLQSRTSRIRVLRT